MIATSLNDWQVWAKSYTMLPYLQPFPLELERVPSWEQAWHEAAASSFVLESGKKGRYSYLGIQPIAMIRGKGKQAEVSVPGEEQWHTHTGEPLALVKEWMAPYSSPRVDDAPPFIGGCVGYWGYDVVRSLENIPEIAADDLNCPDYYFMMVDQVWIIDHHEQLLYCAVHTPITDHASEDKLSALYEQARHQVQEMKLQWDRIMVNGVALDQERRAAWSSHSEQLITVSDIEALLQEQSIFTKNGFINAVERVQHYIRQGDVFQVNLSLRCQRPLESSPERVYEWLRLLNPSPYMGLLRFPELQIASASPELLMKLDERQMTTRPIGGTRKRGGSEREDQLLAEQLLSDEKEYAEHMMLVDLARSDIGKVAATGSVQVTERMALEHYSHVMHIVSEISGTLAESYDGYDLLAAVFPGGSITGMPKIRTMEIIEELEPVRRGPYTGSIGWIGYDGQLAFNIAIRSLVTVDETAYVQAGAGIVLASDAELEYVESLHKMQAIWQAITLSESI